MRLPVIHGLIRRRLLVNFRANAEIMGRFLPAPFRPQLHGGYAVAGICLIRLEEIRPAWLPRFCGLTSENAAHRIAVAWDGPGGEEHEGVFIPRRDTSSRLNHFAGGRLFPGEHHLAKFEVADDGQRVALAARAADGGMEIEVRGQASDGWPSACVAGRVVRFLRGREPGLFRHEGLLPLRRHPAPDGWLEGAVVCHRASPVVFLWRRVGVSGGERDL